MMQTMRQRLNYLLADFLSANLAWFLFNIIRYFTLPYNHFKMSLGSYLSMPTIIIGQCLFPLLMVALFAISGYYNRVFFKSRLDDVLNAAGISLIGALAIFFTALFNDKIDDRLGNFEMILILWGLLAVLASVPRVIITLVASHKIRDRKIAFNAFIVGTSPQAVALANDLEHRHRKMGFSIVGFIDSSSMGHKAVSTLPTYPMSQVQDISRQYDVRSFIIVPDKRQVDDTIATINCLLPMGLPVYLTPNAYHIITSRPRTSMVSGQVLIDVSRANISESTVNLKRLGDIAASAVALLALLPVFAVIAVMVKRDTPGPVFYGQERIGYKKKPFKIYKFRSMYTDAEANGPALSTADDPRITPVGKVLRKYRLDELPQFWNVLRGDMSIVGPRPEREHYLKEIIKRAPYYNIVHQVRPGITSWGMVKYGYASNVDQMLQRMKYDLIYVENVSFAVDLKILFYTINTVITGKGV